MTVSSSKYSRTSRLACFAVFVTGLMYAITTLLGLLSLRSADEPIGDPYFKLMELLTIVIAALMSISMVAVHDYASPADKPFSLAAVLFMFGMTGITSSVHFVILAANTQNQIVSIPNFSFFFSFKWFSVVYALDILAWDWFFPISFLLASFVFKRNRSEIRIRRLMIVSSVLSFAGLSGVLFHNMQIRNIGIIGYAVVAPIVFLLIGKIIGQPKASIL